MIEDLLKPIDIGLSIPTEEYVPILLRAEAGNWIDSQKLAQIKILLAQKLAERARQLPNAPFIEIKGLGFLEVPAEVVVILSQPGIVLGTGFGTNVANEAMQIIKQMYGLPVIRLDLIIWIGTASKAVQKNKVGKQN